VEEQQVTNPDAALTALIEVLCDAVLDQLDDEEIDAGDQS